MSPIYSGNLDVAPEDEGISTLATTGRERWGANLEQKISDSPLMALPRALGQAASQSQEGLEAVYGLGGMAVPEDIQKDFDAQPETPIEDAKQKVQKSGLSIDLPDTPTIKTPALDLMMEHARADKERAATIARGPQDFIPGALDVGTSFLVGAIDPINIAAFSIPVLGEARYGKLLASAGESILGRAALRGGVGVAQGLVGTTLLQPVDYLSQTMDGRDYTMSEALESLIVGAGTAGLMHSSGFPGIVFGSKEGLIQDVAAAARGKPLYSKGVTDVGIKTAAAPAIAGEVPRETAGGSPLAPAEPRAGDEEPAPRAAASGEAPIEPAPTTADLDREFEIAPAGHPAVGEFVVDDAMDRLPYQAKADAMQATAAALMQDQPVRTTDMLKIAATTDPRIADALDYRRTIQEDVRDQLRATGMGEEEADANAAVVAARYATRTQRLGLDADQALELYKGEGLDIQSAEEGPYTVGRAFNQAAKRGGLEGQLTFPGAEEISQTELAKRAANEPLKPTVEQKPMDIGLFGDTAQQTDLLDQIKGRSYDQRTGAPVFYSAVERALTASKQSKATPDQWLGMLRNATGVKPEEMQWLGLSDWLKQQKGAVTKEQVADYVRANQIKIEEVEKGAQEGGTWLVSSAGGPIASLPEARRYPAREAAEQDLAIRRQLHPERYHNALEITPREAVTKFGSYQLPGGQNYRELLLTLPERGKIQYTNENVVPIPGGSEPVANDPGRFWYFKTPDNVMQILKSKWPVEEDARQYVIQFKAPAAPAGENFRSSHWDEPNILAHVRFNDRMIDGKKTLFLEEVQSDWHQKGKRSGYAEPFVETKATDLGEPKLMDEANGKYEVMNNRTGIPGYVWADTPDGAREKALAYFNSLMAHAAHEVGVPDAPFKTTWPELALKRMIRYAAENGYDRVAWTPGDVQAARYDLSKQVDKIQAIRLGDNSYRLDAVLPDGREVMIANEVAPDKIADHVGKDLAKKIVAKNQKRNVAVTYSGADLKVGGEGMSGFYDKILPAAANKLGKKFGARVEHASINTKSELADDNVQAERQPNGEWALVGSDEIPIGGFYATEADAIGALDRDAQNRPGDITEAHSLAITPELRKAALEEGFPLFQSGKTEPQGRITLDQNKAVIQLFKAADASTFMHESSHLWLDEMVRDAARADAPPAVKDDLATALHWLGAKSGDELTTEQHEKWARGFEQYLREGTAPSQGLAATFEKFKQWLVAIYRNLADLGEPIPDEIRGVMNRMVATDEEIASRVEAPSATIHMGPKAARGPRAKDPAHYTLLEFLASRAGLKRTADLDTIFGGKPKFVPGFGPLFRKGGLSEDAALEAATEAGYLHDQGAISGGETQVSIGQLHELLDQEGRNKKVYRIGDRGPNGVQDEQAKATEEANGRHNEEVFTNALKEAGIDETTVQDKTRARVLEIMAKEHVEDPVAAYERAIMEEVYYGAEKGQNRKPGLGDHVPGWDVPVHDDAGPAPNAGSIPAGLRQSAARAGIRQLGADDGKAAWNRLAERGAGNDESNGLTASKEAEELPEPASVEPSKAVAAAEADAAEAMARFEAQAEYMTPEEHTLAQTVLEQFDRETNARIETVRRGIACLTAASVTAVA